MSFFSLHKNMCLWTCLFLCFIVEAGILPVICGVLSALVIFLTVAAAVICAQRKNQRNTPTKGTNLPFYSSFRLFFLLLCFLQKNKFWFCFFFNKEKTNKQILDTSFWMDFDKNQTNHCALLPLVGLTLLRKKCHDMIKLRKDLYILIWSSLYSVNGEDGQQIMHADVRVKKRKEQKKMENRAEVEAEVEYGQTLVKSSRRSWHTEETGDDCLYVSMHPIRWLKWSAFLTDYTTEGPQREEVMSRYRKVFYIMRFPIRQIIKAHKYWISYISLFFQILKVL